MTVPCVHCGLPAPAPGEGEAFCCPGCRAAYGALRAAGLDEFYAVRDRFGGDAQPAVERSDSNAEVFDTGEFLENQTVELPDGSRRCEIHLDGVHCAGCVWLVERMPQVVEGVGGASLNLPRARLTVEWNPKSVDLSDVARWLGRFGYAAYPIDQTRSGPRDAAERRILTRVGIAWALAGNVMLLASALYAGLGPEDGAIFHAARVLSGLLAFASIWAGGREFFRRAWGSVAPWNGWKRLSIDVPISLGISVGFMHSTWAAITGLGEVWYDSIAVLIAALLTARWLQMRGRRAAGDAAERLLSVMPSTARLVDAVGAVRSVDAATLRPGDVVEIRLGDVVPVDGAVVRGETHLQKAVMTGESRPESVVEGDLVHAGETNVGSPVRVRVRAVGDSTRLGRLLHWIEANDDRKAPVVHLADKWSGLFVAAIVFAALLTGVVWTFVAGVDVAAHHTVALLVISCPCALGMATPLAMTVGMGRAARQGIFVKHEDALELVRRVDVALFDKTGTVTRGAMEAHVESVDDEVLRWVAAVERGSNHPIARAFETWDAGHHVDELQEFAGRGAQGVVEGRLVRVGSTAWLDAPADTVSRCVARGMTPVVVEVDGEFAGVIGVGDALRPEAARVLSDLQSRGVETYLVSGDRQDLVDQAASALGLSADHATGDTSPEEKLAFVEKLRSEGRVVAMIGDGVNDSGALKAADVGIAVAGGTQVNYVAADLFLTEAGLDALPVLWDGSNSVMSVVHRNLALSVGYNVLGITLAALGFVSPLFAAVAMPISSVTVVLSSLVGKGWGGGEGSSQRHPNPQVRDTSPHRSTALG